MRRWLTRMSLIVVVGLSWATVSGCAYRYPYKVKKKPSSCPNYRPPKKSR